MTRMPRLSSSVVAIAGMLAACGSGGTMAGGGTGKSAEWATNACKSFPAEAAGQAAGLAVAKTDSPGQTGNEQVHVSTCSYSSADGATSFTVLLRQVMSDAPALDAEIANMKSQPDITGPSEDVAMPKGKAIWQPKMRTLSYVPEAGRMIVVTPPGAIVFGKAETPLSDLKAKAIVIATAAEDR